MGVTDWGKAERRFAAAEQETVDVAMRVPEGPQLLDMLLEIRRLKEDARKAFEGESSEDYNAAKDRLVEKIQEITKFGNDAIRRYNDNARKQ